MARTKKRAAKRGRPPLPPGEGKRHPLNMRTTKELSDKLLDAAARSGRSLAGECEYRLEISFIADPAQLGSLIDELTNQLRAANYEREHKKK